MTKKIETGTIVDHLSNLIVNDELLNKYCHQQIKEHYPEIPDTFKDEDEETPIYRLYWSVLCSIQQSILGQVIYGFNYTAQTKPETSGIVSFPDPNGIRRD